MHFMSVYYQNNFIPCVPLLKRYFFHKVMALTETFPHELKKSVAAILFRRLFSGISDLRKTSEIQATDQPVEIPRNALETTTWREKFFIPISPAHAQTKCPRAVTHPRTQGLSIGKRATLESSDLKSENIGLPVELRMPSFQKNGSTNSLVFHFQPFLLFLKPIKNRSCDGTFESRSLRQACAERKEDSRYENGCHYIEFVGRSDVVPIINISEFFRPSQTPYLS